MNCISWIISCELFVCLMLKCDTMGLSQKEERDLKRALYASLQDSRHTCMTSFNNIASTSTDVIMMRKSQRNPHIISVNMQLCSPKSSSAKKYKKLVVNIFHFSFMFHIFNAF